MCARAARARAFLDELSLSSLRCHLLLLCSDEWTSFFFGVRFGAATAQSIENSLWFIIVNKNDDGKEDVCRTEAQVWGGSRMHWTGERNLSFENSVNTNTPTPHGLWSVVTKQPTPGLRTRVKR